MSLDKAIIITTMNDFDKTNFLFAQIDDRDFLVDKISELLSRTHLPLRWVMFIFVQYLLFSLDIHILYMSHIRVYITLLVYAAVRLL